MIAIDLEKMPPGLNQIVENEGTQDFGIAYVHFIVPISLTFLNQFFIFCFKMFVTKYLSAYIRYLKIKT